MAMLQTRTTAVVMFTACFVTVFGHRLTFEREIPAQQPCAAEEKTWLFAVDGLKRPYSFVNADGDLVGFDVDLIQAVCEQAGKKCKMVLAAFADCAYSYRDMDFAGPGLMSGWFDACPSKVITRDRQAAFDFTFPYLTTVSTFTVAPGNPFKFDPNQDDLSAFTLSHLTGAPTNARCLNRLHKKFGKIIIAKDLPEIRELLLNRTVQAAFSPRTKIDGLEVLPERFKCDQGGAGIMVKRGSTLPSWWNPAYREIYKSGVYHELCSKATVKFNYPIKCFLDPIATWKENWLQAFDEN